MSEKFLKISFISVNGEVCQTHPEGEYTSSTPPRVAHLCQTFCLIGVKKGLATVDSARIRVNLEQVTRLSLNARVF